MLNQDSVVKWLRQSKMIGITTRTLSREEGTADHTMKVIALFRADLASEVLWDQAADKIPTWLCSILLKITISNSSIRIRKVTKGLHRITMKIVTGSNSNTTTRSQWACTKGTCRGGHRTEGVSPGATVWISRGTATLRCGSRVTITMEPIRSKHLEEDLMT